MKKLTHSDYVLRIPSNCVPLEQYTGSLTAIKHKCKTCKTVWAARPSDMMKSKYGCPTCKAKNVGKTNRTSNYEELLELHRPGVTLLSKYVNSSTKVELKHEACGHTYWCFPKSALKHGCPECSRNQMALSKSTGESDIRKLLKTNVPHVRLLSGNRLMSTAKLKCTIHNIEFEAAPYYAARSTSGCCPMCMSRKGVSYSSHAEHVERVALRFPELVVRGKYKSVYDTVRYECNEGHVFDMKPPELLDNRRKIGCPICAIRKGKSNYSKRACSWLDKISSATGLKIQHAKNTGEFVLPDEKIRVDGYNARYKVCFEFHGSIWHGDPKIFEPDSYPHPYSTLTAKELHDNTKRRDRLIKRLGLKLVVIWESDFVKLRTKDGWDKYLAKVSTYIRS